MPDHQTVQTSPGASANLTVFCLHGLGGSAKTWAEVTAASPSAELLGVDLPGFGMAAGLPGGTVSAMADAVVARIRSVAPRRWALVGHSMGGKLAAVVARRAEHGEAGLEGLAGIVLVAASPPEPEPMDETMRKQMLAWFAGDQAPSLTDAATYIEQNVASRLEGASYLQAVSDVRQTNPIAWRHWLELGSRENWSDRVGVLQTPALILSGAEDEALGADTQARLTAPHFAQVRCITMPGAKHLLPLECAEALAALIAEHCA